MRYLAALLLVSFGSAEIIDRIAVTVDKRVITESEIMRQIRITAFLNRAEPDFGAANRRTTAERLLEQLLVRREVESTGYAASPDGAREKYDELIRSFKTPAEFTAELARYRITEKDVREALEWQTMLLDFVDLRFRPGIQVPPSEIQEYYDLQTAMNPGKLPPFDEAKSDIEQILTSQRVDSALDRWLGQERTQTDIRYMREVFQ